ncbi:MAG: AAA family ATPase [Candidatus Protochlamydia sp.]|nr:AAA family ATPase [Candidatus Protochlamydia sp.]
MKRLPIDVSSFDTIVLGNYIYIDKTEAIYNLITAGRYYFLSRPRRFGKSLLISTLSQLFQGKNEFFKGLWIYENSPYDWQEYPVIHLDFSLLAYAQPGELKLSLSWLVTHIAKEYGVDVSDAPFPGNKIQILIEELSRRNKVVILIDEYDYPVINSLSYPEVASENRSTLRQFFSALKGLDRHLHAIFLTGVSKFSKTSIFSGFNNLNDITLDPVASTLLGYTKREILENFSENIAHIAREKEVCPEKIMDEMTLWYDGYRFSKKENFVYNPFSVLYLLQKREFENYWFASGTPSFLMHLLKNQYEEMIDISHIPMPADNLGSFEIENIPLIPVLYQAGYLTIKNYNVESNLYTLDLPNKEVRESFNKYLLATFVGTDDVTVKSIIPRLANALDVGDIPLFMSLLQALFAQIPYQLHIPQEKYYHSLFQLLASILSHESQSEVSTDKGRIDLVIKTRNAAYLFELKLDDSAKNALKQMKEKKYYERYLLDNKKIMLIGLAFKRNENRMDIEFDTMNL